MSKRKKILNIAWVGHGNFGDEAIAFALRRFLSSHEVSHLSYYQSGGLEMSRGQEDINFSFLYKYSNLRWYKKFIDPIRLYKFDTLLIGGGSIFHSENSVRWKLNIARQIKSKGGFVACVGVSFGPFKSELAEHLCAELISLADVVITRDNRSQKWAAKQTSYAKIDNSFDLALLLQDFVPEVDSTNQEYIGFLPTKLSSAPDNNFSTYLEILDHLLEDGHKVKIFSLYKGNEYQDEDLIKRLKDRSISPDNVELHMFDNNLTATINQLATCKVILTSRLHGAIFAYILGIPFISLADHQKSEDFFQEIAYPNEYSIDINKFINNDHVKSLVFTLAKEGRVVYKNSIDPKKAMLSLKNTLDQILITPLL